MTENKNKTEEGAKKRAAEYIYSTLSAALAVFTAALTIFLFFLRPVRVSGDSMNPTLKSGGTVIVSPFFYRPAYGDVIAFGKVNSENTSVIKRVIGLPGDEININFDTHIITVNGKVMTDTFRVSGPISEKGDIVFPVTVPGGCVFVLGDNRNDSVDSRFSEIGFVSYDEILGRAFYSLIPFGRIR